MINSIFSIRKKLLALLVILAPFSFTPYIALPVLDYVSFRVGLYQALALLFVAISTPSIAHNYHRHISDKRFIYAIIAIKVSVIIGWIFAINLGRGLLLGISLLFLLSVLVAARDLAMSLRRKETFSQLKSLMLRAGIFYGIVSIIQLVYALATRTNALLCTGCGDGVFGFARINVFAAEPLFWANALLPFFAVAVFSLSRRYSLLASISLLSTSLAIGLTFARGAIFAVVVVLLLWPVIYLRQNMLSTKSIKRILLPIGAGFLMSCVLLVGYAVVRYSDSPYIAYNTFRGMTEHLTLGVVDLPIKQEPVISLPEQSILADSENTEFISEGLVEASASDRLDSAQMALQAVASNPRTLLFGVGMGNLGSYVTANINPDAPPTLTVYIFYVLFLAELGLVGLLALIYLFVSVIKRLLITRVEEHWTVAVILIAFMAQFFFLGSYINVVYVWLWLGLAHGLILRR